MARDLPPMLAIRAFEAAARHASFVRAGAELHVTAGAVGHQVRQLEEWLGLPVFVRRPRSVHLTDAGRRYFDEVRGLLDDLEQMSAALKGAGAPAEVTVTAMPSFVTRWLMPRLGRFRALHPAIEVRLLASVPPVDFTRDRVDLAIRLGTGPYPQHHAEVLLDETFHALASPALAASVDGARDLANHTLLHDEFEPRIAEQIDWPRWLAAQGAGRVGARLRQGLRFSHTYLALDAAAAGQGIAVASTVLAGDAVDQGLLALCPGKGVPGPYRYHLLTARGGGQREQVRLLCAWLREEASRFSRKEWGPPA
jgi:LysR family glycine cleavage system transcriptional activator